jgi:hypothetical protein
MNIKSKILFATLLVTSCAAPAFADEPESLVNNLVITRSSEPVLIMQATPVQYRNQAPAPRYDYNTDEQDRYDAAKGNVH